MSHVFSDFVRALKSDGSEPTAEAFDAVWRALADRLRREIRRRGLWTLPPSYLGLTGHTQWHPDAVDELVAPCYQHIFLDRIGGLVSQLAVKGNVDGLVVLHVRNFVHEAQKRHDPLGFRVYNVLRTAIERAVEDGEIRVVDGEPRLRNDSILVFDEALDIESKAGANSDNTVAELADAAPKAVIVDMVRRWNDLLLPDLVTAQGRAQASVVDLLRRRLFELPACGIEVVRFAAVIEPLKQDARYRWANLLDQDFGDVAFVDDETGLPQLIRRLEPDSGWAEQHDFDVLVACVTEAVDHDPSAPASRYLDTLWQFLRTWSTVGHEAVDGPRLPSKRKLANLLNIPRDRLGRLFTTLGELVEACLSADAANFENAEVIALRPRATASPRSTA